MVMAALACCAPLLTVTVADWLEEWAVKRPAGSMVLLSVVDHWRETAVMGMLNWSKAAAMNWAVSPAVTSAVLGLRVRRVRV